MINAQFKENSQGKSRLLWTTPPISSFVWRRPAGCCAGAL